MKDETQPTGKWEFDQTVTEVFDDMLSRSIPGYEDMRRLTTALACEFAQDNTYITDLGCSRGGSLAPIIEVRTSNNKYLGIEISEPMRSAAQNRFSILAPNVSVEILDLDLREDFPKVKSSVVMSILTLQFIPIEYRQEILRKCFLSLNKKGAIILVEKTLGNDSFTNNLFVKLYYELKGANGYTEEQINSKRRALEGVLVPVTSDWNQELLESAGFSNVEMFWKNLNFVGWIGVKS